MITCATTAPRTPAAMRAGTQLGSSTSSMVKVAMRSSIQRETHPRCSLAVRANYFDEEKKKKMMEEQMRKKEAMDRQEKIVDVDSVAHARQYAMESLEAAFALPSLAEQEPKEPEGEGPLVCAACSSPVTHHMHKTTVRRKHEHWLYGTGAEAGRHMTAYGAFSEAETKTYGDVEAEAGLDFPPANKQPCVCGGCGVDLGWKYDRSAVERVPGFFLLILSKLKEGAEGAGK